MADSILNLKKVEANGLLSKIQIGGKTYEIKDLIARENIDSLRALLLELSGNHTADIERIDAAIEAIQKAAYDDTALRALITDLQNNKADKEQVSKDITAAVAAEAEIARAAEKANADEIARVDAALKLAIDDEDGKGLNSIKDLAAWVEEHGEDAAEMSAAITKNAEDIVAMDKAYKAADEAIDGRLDVIEAALGEGEGSVADQITDAKDAAIEAAKGYTDGREVEINKAIALKEDKANLKALAYKDSASGTVAGETISGVKASGTSTGSITVELEQSEHAMNSTGKYTPVGNVAGSVTVASHNVPVALNHSTESATLTKGDYTPAGDVAVVLAGGSFNAITGVGTQASFVEGTYTPANLVTKDVTIAAHNHLEATMGEDECLVFTAPMVEALTFKAVDSFTAGSKAADTFVANSLPTMAAHTVGVESSTFTGTKAENLVVTGVSYSKATDGNGTCAGGTYDIDASFTGSESDISVAGLCHDYAVKTAEFNGAAIELNVGDIVVAAKEVTVQ